MNLFEYEKIGPENLRKCEIEWKMTSLLMQKYLKSKECRCRGFVYKKHTSAAAYMMQLTFVYILYSFCTNFLVRGID